MRLAERKGKNTSLVLPPETIHSVSGTPSIHSVLRGARKPDKIIQRETPA
jgi:hypothetical protein